ncbi:MAG: thioredoxin domain-containing protein [Geminicoccaceae bacterium]
MKNRLRDTTSPYLIQHQDNPVHWQPWDKRALAAAKAADKPILLSIGYSACHWCHVMAHESFENEAIAALMNLHFVNIKIDREERPDLDQIYMRALGLLGQQGGWPLTMFLTPDGEPFWGGTYFPPESRYGRPGFPEVLTTIANIWSTERHKVDGNKKAIVDALGTMAAPKAGEVLAVAQADDVARHLVGVFDPVHGGLKGAPKFPQSPILDFLWRRSIATDDVNIKNAVVHTLNRICQGGIFDHLGGGFARYSVDDRWLVPHFEKMLYDNAQLLGLLADVYIRTADPLLAARAREAVGWLEREMMVGDGFASALDADSEGEEGKFYVWDAVEIEEILGGEAEKFKTAFDVQEAGNWEGKTILNRSWQDGLYPDDEEAGLQAMAARLLEVREKRVRPGRDDKVLADWNGLMIAALARASAVFGEPTWLTLAERAFQFVRENMTDGDRIAHSFRDGRTLDLGFVDDYAAMADAALGLFQQTGRADYRVQAAGWVAYLDDHFRDPDHGGYFQTADDASDVLVRPKNAQDGPSPAGNGLMATVLARLFDLTGDERFQRRANELMTVFAGEARENPAVHATLLSGLAMLDRPVQIVLVGATDEHAFEALRRTALEIAPPGATVQAIAPDASLPQGHPAKGKGMVDGKSAAYLCEGQTCRLPITDTAVLVDALR